MLRIDHIEHIFNATDQFFLLTSFFVLIREAFKQRTEDEKENGWDRIKALFDVRSVLSVQKKITVSTSFFQARVGGGG